MRPTRIESHSKRAPAANDATRVGKPVFQALGFPEGCEPISHRSVVHVGLVCNPSTIVGRVAERIIAAVNFERVVVPVRQRPFCKNLKVFPLGAYCNLQIVAMLASATSHAAPTTVEPRFSESVTRCSLLKERAVLAHARANLGAFVDLARRSVSLVAAFASACVPPLSFMRIRLTHDCPVVKFTANRNDIMPKFTHNYMIAGVAA